MYTRYSRLSNRLSNGFDNCWMFVYTIQPVVKPVWQQVVSCKQGLRNNGRMKMKVTGWLGFMLKMAIKMVYCISWLYTRFLCAVNKVWRIRSAQGLSYVYDVFITCSHNLLQTYIWMLWWSCIFLLWDGRREDSVTVSLKCRAWMPRKVPSFRRRLICSTSTRI